VKNLENAFLKPTDRDEWGKIYDKRDPVLKARMLRTHTRNPQLRLRYLIKGLNSEDADDSKKAVLNAVIENSTKSMLLLRENMFDATCFKRLIRAKFDDDNTDNVIDLIEDDEFTEMNTTSKAQIARLIMQSIVVASILS
jgi:hypothetical protein